MPEPYNKETSMTYSELDNVFLILDIFIEEQLNFLAFEIL